MLGELYELCFSTLVFFGPNPWKACISSDIFLLPSIPFSAYTFFLIAHQLVAMKITSNLFTNLSSLLSNMLNLRSIYFRPCAANFQPT